ncbi:MAG TPA: hypothetical protein VGT03_13580 [Candidatus Acidoferrales bacterium]|nr:hypothetical protein [Candidatus Acidoferrales bacterium]
MAFFIVLIVALVAGLTWWDWREVQRQEALPDWATGAALAGMIGAALIGITSMGSALYNHTVSELQTGLGSGMFLPQLIFLTIGLGVILLAVRKKSARTLLLLAGILMVALWLGFTFSA